MRKVVRIPFSGDPIQTALNELGDPSLAVFPTRVSAAQARDRYMQGWQLQDSDFITMDQLKDSLLLPDGPCVNDDRRMLCLFQALTEEDRNHFHIEGYFDVVEWGNRFFQLFTELCDECVPIAKLEDPFGYFGVNLLLWQEDYLDRVLKIRSRYLEVISSLGFTDRIFFWLPNRISVPWSGNRIVFVNQLYYSKLEQEILTQLEDAGNETVLITQFPAGAGENDALDQGPLSLTHLKPQEVRLQKVEIIDSGSPDQMIMAFLAEQVTPADALPERSVVVDSRFHQSHYQFLFDPEKLRWGTSRSMVSTGLYSFLALLHRQIGSLRSNSGKSFLPLRLLLDSFSQPAFLAYYHPEWGELERAGILKETQQLLERDFLYMDTDLELLNLLAEDLEQRYLPAVLRPHFHLLDKLAEISAPQGLINLIDTPGGLRMEAMCSREELDFSDILDQFYARLANFASLQRLPAVGSWQGLFDCAGPELAASVLRLFLESLAGASVRWRSNAGHDEQLISISNLLDLRNLNYDTVVFLNAIEGEYPSSPNPAWLFNENQRRLLGLKSYPLLREWERYYFFRQVFSARNVFLYSYSNQEKEIEQASFLTELQHFLEENSDLGIKLNCRRLTPEASLLFKARRGLLAARAKQELTSGESLPDPRPSLYSPDQHGLDKDNPDEFFTLPPAPKTDFGIERLLRASYQSLSLLTRNPFAWYVEQHSKLKKIELRPQETISRKFFGALLHGYVSRVLNSWKTPPSSLDQLKEVLDSPEDLRHHLQEQLDAPLNRYKLPLNYNHEFLAGIIFDCLVESVRQFYHSFLMPNLRYTSFRLLPEKEREFYSLEGYKTLVQFVYDHLIYTLNIRGVADLRIETPQRNTIVDFKTGNYNEDQLFFYEWYYYLLDPEYDGRELNSTFWKILDRSTDKKTSPAKRDAWRTEMQELLLACLSKGYPQSRLTADRRYMQEITRADLYHPSAGAEE